MKKNTQCKVLLVDDDPITLMVVQRLLESAGYEVLTRDTPFGTSGQILKHRPDVLLLDVEMPAIDGELLAEMVGKGLHRVEIVFYSGKDASVLDRLVKKYNALGAIRKSAEGNEFLRQFNALVAKIPERKP